MNEAPPWALPKDPNPAKPPAWRWGAHSAPWRWALSLTLLLLIGQALPGAKFFSTPAQYLPLHTGLEFISMAVSAMVFALAWNLRRQADNSQLMLLGTGFLAVSVIDFAHTLSYAGMPDWVTPSGAEKAINFWLAGRLVAALVLLAVALQPLKHWSEATCRSAVWVALLGAAGVVWLGLTHSDVLPRTFVPGQGLTVFKITSEYLLMLIYGLASVLIYLKSRPTDNRDLQWLAASAWVQGLAELFFTLYVDVTDLYNLLGHIYKAVAYLMVVRALFSAGVRLPFQKLQESQNKLRELTELLNETEQVGKVGGWTLDLTTGAQTWTHQVYAIGKPDPGRHRLYGFIQDITERTRIEEEVRLLAFHDTLTQLPNRRLLNDRLHQALATSQRSGHFGAVMLLDLDNFKSANDTHGHGVGDLLLQEVARRLLACVRASDTVARVGGDEFVVLITELNTNRAASILQAYAVAEKIRLSLAEPYLLHDPHSASNVPEITHHCTACIGLVMFLDHEASPEELLKWADAAMYKVKNAGRNAIHFHQSRAEPKTLSPAP